MFAGLLGLSGGAGGLTGGSATSGDISSPFTNNASFTVGGSGRTAASADSGIPSTGITSSNTGLILAVVGVGAVVVLALILKK